MSYEVLARKYRSKTFDEIVGQTAIATTLKNAVACGRIHHGYLFTGTRGVGKTSMARILAKALNCLASDAPTPTPCCTCDSCVRIGEGRDLDVVEIDAASNTGVDDIRELRSNAAFRPVRSRFKVYIIDEVHMLSINAFNALLKILEEPPEHVKFILATTESHKVPATIRSRCQRFDFRSISPAAIGEQLESLLASEQVTADKTVIRRVARLANGSMRDALSILDQLLAFGTSELSTELMEDLLPSAHSEGVSRLVDAICADDAAAALTRVDELLGTGYTPARLCDAMIEHLRALMLLRVCGGDTELIDASGALREQLNEQSGKQDAAGYVWSIGLLEQARRQLHSGGASRAVLDAVVVRLAMSASFCRIDDILERLDASDAAPTTREGPKKKAEPAGLTRADDRPDADDGPGAHRRPDADGRPGAQAVPGVARSNAPATPVAAGVTSPDRSVVGTDAAEQSDEPTAVPVARAAVTSEVREKVIASPLVRQVMELTGGRIVDIRPASDGASRTEPNTTDGHPDS